MQNNSKHPTILTIAGSDSGAGAGIQADIKAAAALGCYATTAITAVTAQNTLGVSAIYTMPDKIIEQQILCVLDDIGADAIKIGMLATPEIARLVGRILTKYPQIPVILDPVLVATSGDTLSNSDTIDIIINELMPISTLITPNVPEALALTNNSEDAWGYLKTKGCNALLLKGGHGEDSEMVTDRLFLGDAVHEFSSKFIDTKNTHGTGCTLSSAIASYMALGYELVYAVELAHDYVHHAIASAVDINMGAGHSPVHHFFKQWE